MDLDALLKLAQGKKSEIAARSTFSNVAKIPNGKSRWRILPGWDAVAPQKFFHDFGQHYIKNREGDVIVVYTCEMDTFGRECGICDRVNDAIRSTKDDATLKVLKEMKSRQIQLVNALRLDGAEANAKQPVLLGLPSSVMGAYLSVLSDYQTEHGINILDAAGGHDITIERTGTGLTTKYGLQPSPKASTVDPEALTRLIDIAAYCEGEFQKGVRKGTALFESTARSLIGSSFAGSSVASAGTGLLPAGAARVATAADRVIDAEDVTWSRPEPTPVVSSASPSIPLIPTPTPAATPATAAVAAASATASSTPTGVVADNVLDDAELAKILAELDA